MLGLQYIKFDTMDHIIHYQNGKVKKEGKGLSFFYFAPNSSIVKVPMNSSDLRFIFTEATKDFQQVTVQGQITYRIAEPAKAAALLNFTVNENKQYISDDFEKLEQRLINEAQASVSSFVLMLNLRDAITSIGPIEQEIIRGLANSKVVNTLGLEILSVNVFDVKASPEMAKALEAQTREALQQEADKAIYDRRNFAVEQERKIRESELNTEIAVEEKQKQIAQKQMETEVAHQEKKRKISEMEMATQIAMEEEKRKLIDTKVENEKKEADAQEYVLKANLKPYKEIDWKTLMAINNRNFDPKMQMALAFREMAENAGKIGNLNISPDLLESIINTKRT